MSTKKIIIFVSVSFLCGILGGFFCTRYLLPKIGILENNLKEENVYEVEHNDCPVEEKPSECSIYVDISGALKNPGVYCFNSGDLIIDAVKKAGGFNTKVALEYVERNINLSKPLTNGLKLYFPSTSELICTLKPFTLKEEEVLPPSNQIEEVPDNNNSENTTSSNCININTGTITQLDSLDGVGASTAQKIIDNRPYSKIEDLLNVSGIGEATYNKFKNNICI